VIAVNDTTAITSLLKIQRADVLQTLFSDIRIPAAVAPELTRRHPSLPEFIEVCTSCDRASADGLLDRLDAGKAEAIALARELHADALLIDERAGRTIAEAMGIRCVGLAGALLPARQLDLIPSLTDILNELESRANFYLAGDVRAHLLELAGE
jgi:hypothetical protein